MTLRVCRSIYCHKLTSMKTFACMKTCRRRVKCSNEAKKGVRYVMINRVLVTVNVNLFKIHDNENALARENLLPEIETREQLL